MTKQEEIKTSKFLSLVLRHQPETIGITLDEQGWVATEELIDKCNRKGTKLDFEKLQTIVKNCEKQRFAFNEDLSRIRANQGHSVQMSLGYTPQQPPATLYHGTASRNLESIRQKGLEKGNRHEVHLSIKHETAIQVGERHGKPVVLTIQSEKMHRNGILFYLSDNGVWLTDHVPPQYIDFPTNH